MWQWSHKMQMCTAAFMVIVNQENYSATKNSLLFEYFGNNVVRADLVLSLEYVLT